MYIHMCVCVCVQERERERERDAVACTRANPDKCLDDLPLAKTGGGVEPGRSMTELFEI